MSRKARPCKGGSGRRFSHEACPRAGGGHAPPKYNWSVSRLTAARDQLRTPPQYGSTLSSISRPSEVRFVCPRHIGVLSRVPLDVFGANMFFPFLGTLERSTRYSISHGRGPRRREDAFILNRESELEELALRVRLRPKGSMLLCVPNE